MRRLKITRPVWTAIVGAASVCAACGPSNTSLGNGAPRGAPLLDAGAAQGDSSSSAGGGGGIDAGGPAGLDGGEVDAGDGSSADGSGHSDAGAGGAGADSGERSDAGGAGDSGHDAGTVTRPCDIYASGNAPCVAAHSTVRALYGSYTGSLYQVTRASDGTTRDVGVLTPGGFADSAAQDAFCAGTTCAISILYDQSSKKNHLRSAPAGGFVNTPDKDVSATALKLTVGGHAVYGIHITSGTGYRNDKTSGVATGDEPETEYMVTSGTFFNNGCCFDYGNAETDNRDDGNGTMEAVYLGMGVVWGTGSGTGPWVEADLENGLFAGGTTGKVASNMSVTSAYVTAMVVGRSGSFAIKGGNAQSGTLTTMYDGTRPNGYNPMKKQGAILLGIGGDNSDSAQGNFYEGVMTSGNASSAIDDAVQANIVAAGYGH